MMLPFTREQFFDVFVAYNDKVWPTQIVLVALALAMVGTMGFRNARKWIGWGLAAMWAWMGIAYHIVFFSAINHAAYVFGAAFVTQAILFARATRNGTLAFGVPRSAAHAFVGALLVAYALLGYPLLAYAAGQHYPAVPTFGLPCPTTIFTFGLLAWTVRPPSWFLLVIPLAWAVVGTSAAASLRVPEDWGLIVAAASLLALNLRRTAADRERLRSLYE